MDISKRTAWFMLAAINLMTAVKHFANLGWYELMFWLAAAFPALLFRKSGASPCRRVREGILVYGILFTGVYLALWWVSGYIDGFGHSPYARSLPGIFRNLCLYGGIIVAQEWTRSYILKSGGSGNWTAAVVASSFFLYSLNFPQAQNAFHSWSALFQFTGETLLPGICGTIFLTWMSKTAGALAPLIYRLVPDAVQWLLPALPNSSWQTKMMLGAAIPVFAMLTMQIAPPLRRRRRAGNGWRRRQRTKPSTWVGLALAMAFLFSFSLGLLPYKPMVIATGSMLPVIRPGDMVILQDTDTRLLQVGDVIAYQTQGYQIVHRITAILPSARGNSYILKGDNNDAPDINPVQHDQIMGKVVGVIPYVGLLALSVRSVDSPQSVPVQTGS